MNKRKEGSYWEYKALLYLEAKGFVFLFKNWTCRWGEIDLIFLDESFLVFVEVKFKGSIEFGSPWEFVTFRKRKNQLKAIKIFLSDQRYKNYPWRFDVMSVTKIKGQFQFQHFEAVPLPGAH